MKIQKLIIFVCMFFLLSVGIVFASDMNPMFTKFNADSTNVAQNATINIQVRDVNLNPGILWIKLYEVGTGLIDNKNCGSLTLCSWEPQISRPAGGTFSYYAQAMDKGGNSKDSNTIQITYNAKNISTCSLTFDPPGPTPPVYGTPVNTSCSCDNPEASAVLTRNGLDVTLTENDQFVNLSAAAHDYECSVIETTNYMNATTGSVIYIVDPANTTLNLTALPSWNEFNGTQTTVSCNADNIEVSVELFRDGSPVSNPDVQTLTNGTYVYDCNATASQNYTAPVPVTDNLTISLAPPLYVLWNSPMLNMGSTFQSATETDLENITSTGNNTNVNVGCVSGDCPIIADLWTDGTNMTDNETQIVDFTCNSAVVGNYSAIFDVVSDEYPAGDQINVSCEVIPAPPITISWNNVTLDLGSGERGAGVLTGSENINAIDDHTNVVVSCLSFDPNCGTVITDNFVDGVNMTDGETQAITFTCNDSTAGNYTAVFDLISDEDNVVDQIAVSCEITIPIATTGNIVINEFMAQPSTGNDWVELYNNDINAVDLTGWVLNDSLTTSSMATLSGILYPGVFLLVDVSTRLNMGGDDVILIDSTNTTVDNYTYAASQVDVSIGRYPDGDSTWLNMTTPTPAASNLPDVYVLWDTNALDLGQGGQGAGVLTGTSNITSTQANTQVEVTCLSGCGAITDDWVDKNMTDMQSDIVTFTCDDTTIGNFSALFEVSSDEYLSGDQINVTCEILLVPAYGVSLTDPADLATDNATDAVYTITVSNTGNVADIYDLTVNNIDGATTALLNQSTVSLGVGASADVTLTVGDVTAGTYAVNVTATSQTDITATGEIDTITTVSVVPVYNVNINYPAGVDQQITSTQTAVYALEVTNTGNQVDSYDLTVNNINNADTASLDTYTITNLNPGAVANIQLSVADSTPGDYDVTVTATSQTNSSITDTTTGVIRTRVIQAIGSMSGTVSDADNDIYNALVELKQGASVIASTNTDTNGDYSFSNIAVGTYDVVVVKAGFNDDITSDTINEGANTVHDVTLTQAVFAGSVAGTILDGTDGVTTIPGATVTITRTDNAQVVQIITSDAVGDYVFNGLPPTVGFTYDLDVNVPYSGYTTVFPPTGMSLTSGQARTGEDIYLI